MKESIVRWVRKSPVVFDVAKKVTRALGVRSALYDLLLSHRRCRTSLTFVQGGAHDGITNDPIREFVVRFGWRGVVVEPVPQSFDLLEKNYRRHAGVYPVRGAVSPYGRPTLSIYRLRKTSSGGLPYWIGQVASSNKSHLHRFFPQAREDEIEELSVPAFSVEKLVDRFSLETCEFLALDIEGLEAEVIQNTDFKKLQTQFVLFEKLHMTTQGLMEVEEHLRGNGFEVVHLGNDILAVRS